MPVEDYNKKKQLEVSTVNDSGTTQDKAQPILVTGGDDSTTGTGDIVIDFANISDTDPEQDIAVYDQDGNLLDYEIKDLDTTAETATLWAYNSWTRDDSVQAQIAYGDNSADEDRSVAGTGSNPWDNGQSEENIYHANQTNYPTDNLIDSNTTDRDGNVTGATSTTGQINGAYDSDGVDDVTDLGSASAAPIAGATSATFSTWVKHENLPDDTGQRIYNLADSSGADMILGTFESLATEGGGTNDGPWILIVDDGGNILQYRGSTTGSNLINEGEWHHMAVSWAGANDITIYLDGEDVTGSLGAQEQQSPSEIISNASEQESFGARLASDGATANNFDGKIDETQIYSTSKSSDWIQADYDASPKGGQVYFSQQAAEQTVTDQTASIPVTQNTQTTPDPQVQAGTVTVSTPTTILTQSIINPQLQPGTAPLNIQETQLAASNPDITLQLGASRIQVTPTALTQTTENLAVNATFDLSIPETQLTASNPDLNITLGSTILAPETQLTATNPDIQLTPGESLVTVPETQLTATNPEIGLNRIIVFGVTTQLTTENPEPNLQPGIVEINVTETQLVQTTEDPQVVPGETQVQVTPPTRLTVFTPDFVLTPGATDLNLDETQLIQTTPQPSIGLDLQFVSPTNALITNKNRYFDMADHTFKQNDFGDTFTATLKDEDNPNGVSIKGNTGVNLVVEKVNGTKVLDKEMTVTDADNGKVEYSWETGDFIEDVGVYRAEIKVFDSTDEPETFPNEGYRSVTVEDELE